MPDARTGPSPRLHVARSARARRAPIGHLAAIATMLWALGVSPTHASAAAVVILGHNGQAAIRDDPFLAPQALTPAPASAPVRHVRPAASIAAQRTVRTVLAHLERTRQITRPTYLSYSRDFSSALNDVRRLSAARAAELIAVLDNLHAMAVNGAMTASRLPVLFLTLDRNHQYWRSGPALSYGQRVEFAGSELVWEYYPGQGIELQQLGSFGKADWLCTAGASHAKRCRTILSELIPLAARRARGLTWECYFNFDGGAPPWTSAMSQGTALQTLADAYKELGDKTYLSVAHRALPVFSAPPPTGVGITTKLGMRYVQYSFASAADAEIINAFLQTLVGLDDYAKASRDPVAQRLFAAGNAEALAELPHFNTGAWSLYQPGLEDDLSYHRLVTGFLQQLCSMTKIPTYCRTAAAFQRDVKTPPALKLVTTHVRANRPALVYFTVSKISRVGITVIHNHTTVFLTSASVPYGQHEFAIPALASSGTYTVRLDATDLAGNYNQISTPLLVSR
jgi:D-glucuronyl C5-epimerase C-terminus